MNKQITNHQSPTTNNKPLRVLFVASGNKAVGKCSAFVQSQYDSLVAEGLDMELYSVVGHGVKGFLSNLLALRGTIKTWQPDVIHAHYSTFGILASIASCGIRYPKNHKSQITNKPKILVSILGSFPYRNGKWKRVKWAIQHLWDGTLLKSKRTANQLGLDLPVVPNGVNLEIFHPISESEREGVRLRLFSESAGDNAQCTIHNAQFCTGVSERESERENLQSKITNHQSQITNHKYIIWCSNPSRPEKNWALAQEAVELYNAQCTMHNAQLVAIYNKTPQAVAQYMNAADCLLLTSDREGSPNVIKEAMACNCPIVTTNVGDVSERLQGLDGCYIVEDNDCRFTDRHKAAILMAEQIKNALMFGKRTRGYERIMEDGLTVELTAKKIIKLYESL